MDRDAFRERGRLKAGGQARKAARESKGMRWPYGARPQRCYSDETQTRDRHLGKSEISPWGLNTADVGRNICKEGATVGSAATSANRRETRTKKVATGNGHDKNDSTKAAEENKPTRGGEESTNKKKRGGTGALPLAPQNHPPDSQTSVIRHKILSDFSDEEGRAREKKGSRFRSR